MPTTKAKTKPTSKDDTARKAILDDLLQSIRKMSNTEQIRLCRFLTPVIKTRTAMMDFVLITIPADLAKLKEVEQECSAAAHDSPLNSIPHILEEKLDKARKKVNGTPVEGWCRDSHQSIRIKLGDMFKKAKDVFSKQY